MSPASRSRGASLRPALKRLRFWCDALLVVRPNGIALLAACALCFTVLPRLGSGEATFFNPASFFPGLGFALAVVFLLCTAPVFLPYAWFFTAYYILRRDRNQILFTFPRDACALGQDFTIDAILQRKLRLLFGAITFRLVLFNYDTTDRYFLLRNQRRRGELFNSADRGSIASFSIRFRHLGRYRTRYSVVRFEDPLGFCSFPIIEREHHPSDRERNYYLYCLPPAAAVPPAPAFLRRASVPSVSEQRFKVAEDFFDTKRYEPSDDSRRILWPVFSRMRQLLVRIPERDSVVDADIDVHVLFHRTDEPHNTEAGRREFDCYVGAVMRALEGLLRRRALTIRLFTDGAGDPPWEDDPHLTKEENLRRALVCNAWHADTAPGEYLAAAESTRPADRERILIVHPFLDAGAISDEQIAAFSAAWLLGTDALELPAPHRLRLATVSDRGLIRSLLERRMLQARLRRRHVNRMQLARRFREEVVRGAD